MAKLARPEEFKDTRQLPSEPVMMEIGRLAIVAASIEEIMHSLHWKYAGLSEAVGPVITGDARASRLSEDVLRISKAAEIDPLIIEDLKDIFSDFSSLTQERNKFIHWIWSWNTETGEDRIDPPGYKPTQKGKFVSVEAIGKIADDLVWIEHRLSAHLMSEEETENSKKTHGLKGAIDAPTPWLR